MWPCSANVSRCSLDARRERVRGVAVVVEVELDLAEAGARELRELIEEVRAVLLAGEEPAVARRAAVAVAELAERGVALGPRVDARACRRRRERCPTAARSDRRARTGGGAVRAVVASAHGARGGVRNRAASGGGSFCEGGPARWLDVRPNRRDGSLRSAAREGAVSGVRSSARPADRAAAALPADARERWSLDAAARSAGRPAAPAVAPCVPAHARTTAR